MISDPGLTVRTPEKRRVGVSHDEGSVPRIPFTEILGAEGSRFTERIVDLAELDLILHKATRNSALICAPAGSGKTALVESFAAATVGRTTVHRVDVAKTMAGTSHRGALEERFVAILDAAVARGAVLFIDEIHAIRSMGTADGALDLLDLLKPYLVHPRCRIIGATTPAEIEPLIADLAFRRRFSVLQIAPLTPAELAVVFERAIDDDPLLDDCRGEFERILRAVTSACPARAPVDALTDFLEYFAASRRVAGDTTSRFAEVLPTDFDAVVARFAATHDLAYGILAGPDSL